MRKVEAHGKHLFIGFDNALWVHVHLGLFGKWRFGTGEAPEPRGQVRMVERLMCHAATMSQWNMGVGRGVAS